MDKVSIYLNFMGKTEEAFRWYAEVFRSEITSFERMRAVSLDPGAPPLSEAELDLVMHVELPILGGAVLMGTDMLESMGHELRLGNNMTINLEPEELGETQRLFAALSEGGSDVMPLTLMFWGAQWGTCCDRFGIRWMFNWQEPAT
ncbi:MAG: PhnB protein [Actinomycetota bacterium]|jgi:PhnB protein|nr:PhnB protein [Actinomycetota bacterium]